MTAINYDFNYISYFSSGNNLLHPQQINMFSYFQSKRKNLKGKKMEKRKKEK